ncbi:hypothetical protein cypCar_00014279 [Cyprinus carpio]|nr:hypothetical protein cypCar_00014279 [Cyprinus carpio]
MQKSLPPPRDEEEKAMLDSMLRVDHAGEYGANRIYAGQMAVLGRTLIQVLNVPGYLLLKTAIQVGCKAAIYILQRI